MQNTPIKKNSIIKKHNKYSFKLCCILFQLTKRHNKINNVVNIIKNKEIPSTPIVTFKFKDGIQKILVTNWKIPKDLLNITHKIKEQIKVKHEKFKAINFNICLLVDDVNIKKNDPNKGNNKT
jgi:hypothetical protein